MTTKLPKTITFETPPTLVGVRKGTYNYKKDTIITVKKNEQNIPFFTLKNTKYVQTPNNPRKFVQQTTRFGFTNESWKIYTREGCPYCVKAKETLSERIKGNNGTLKIIDGKTHVDQVKNEMKRVNREDFKTWPKIFLNNEFIGGFTDLQNKLKSLQ